jgi:hypothetical protein
MFLLAFVVTVEQCRRLVMLQVETLHTPGNFPFSRLHTYELRSVNNLPCGSETWAIYSQTNKQTSIRVANKQSTNKQTKACPGSSLINRYYQHQHMKTHPRIPQVVKCGSFRTAYESQMSSSVAPPSSEPSINQTTPPANRKPGGESPE